MSEAQIRIGTSGWSYKHWRGKFYPSDLPVKGWLDYYQKEFDTAEINNSFYRLPSEETYAQWAEQVDSNFLFAVKGSRFLTHMKKLKDAEEPWDNIVSHSDYLGERRGPVLLQFPERWNKNLLRLEEFFEITTQNTAVDIALEFRNESWFSSDVYRLLEKYDIALCIADSDKFRREDRLTSHFSYFRYHGRGAHIYADSYSGQQLKKEAKLISKFAKDGTSVFVYFNNDGNANAIKNAKTLRKLIDHEMGIL